MSQDYVQDILNSYPNNVLKLFGYSEEATNSLTIIAKELTELFNFIEPGLFDSKIIVVKNFKDIPIFPVGDGYNLKMDKAKLTHIKGDFVIQLFSNRDMVLWQGVDYEGLLQSVENICYMYDSGNEFFFAKEEKIDVSVGSFGSRFSGEFADLESQLLNYAIHKVRHSSCPILLDSWNCENRIFFKGGGKDMPERYMQLSLHNFIKDISIFKGDLGQLDPTREHNLDGSKPVDIIVRWEKSNRIALIEVKWLGKSISEGVLKSKYYDARANEGFKQLKNYFELAKKDNPNKIIKCYLVVIDARRRNTNEGTTTVSVENGLYYETKEIELRADRMYHLAYKNLHKPLRMFVEPVCE